MAKELALHADRIPKTREEQIQYNNSIAEVPPPIGKKTKEGN